MNTITYQRLLVLCSFSMLFAACQQAPQIDPAVEKAEILKLHQQQRKFHFEKMSKELIEQFSNQHISVNRGLITPVDRAAYINRFDQYFNSVSFEKWDDIKPPVIRFSDDYSMAYTIVNKEVVVLVKDKQGNDVRSRTEFSWVAIYKKYPEGWKMDCMASTNLPDEVKKTDDNTEK